MRLRVPTPRDVLESAEELAGAVPRTLALLGTAEQVLADAAGLVARVGRVVDDVERVTAEADRTVDRVGRVVDDSDAAVRRVGLAAGRAEELLDRAAALLDDFEPSLRELAPVARRFAETTHEREVDALVQLVDHAPELARRMEEELLPVMASLGSVAPDLHDLLDIARELNATMSRMPGLRRIKRKVEEAQQDEEDGGGATAAG